MHKVVYKLPCVGLPLGQEKLKKKDKKSSKKWGVLK